MPHRTIKPPKSRLLADHAPFAELVDYCRHLEFRAHEIGASIDARGHYLLPLDRDFPFCVTLFHLQSSHYTPGWNWHEYMEIFMTLDGPIRMRMGESTVQLDQGDLLIVDNLKLHNVENTMPFDTRAIVIGFLPSLVYTPGSPSCDYTFLLPFFSIERRHPQVLRGDHPDACQIHAAILALLQRYVPSSQALHNHCGCKAAFLELLFRLLTCFQTEAVLRSEFIERRQQAERLARIFEYVSLNYTEKISVSQAARLVHMSETQFMKAFRRGAGMTFVTYLTKIRLNHAVRLLRQSALTIADVATAVGFSDQSYFDRRFKQSFGKSPRDFRAHLNRTTEEAPSAPTERSVTMQSV